MAGLYGVDLGTCNLKLYMKHSGNIIQEKNTIAVINRNQLYAFGDEAYAMLEKVPETIEVSFPIQDGVIAEYDHLQALIIEIMGKYARGRMRGAEFVIAIPTGTTEVEKKAFYDLFYRSRLKPRLVLLCDKPIAAAAGVGIDVTKPDGALIVDMGADTTEISVISLGGLVQGNRLHVGGNRLDDAIISYIRKTYNMTIGRRTAIQLKEELGSALPGRQGVLGIVGRNMVTGLPSEIKIDCADVYEAIRDIVTSLCGEVRLILEQTPPELSKDIVRSGIYLSGGLSKLHGIEKLMQETCGVSINLCDMPEQASAKGLGIIATNDKFKHLAYSMRTRIFR